MSSRPFPAVALRDALGAVRLLYAARLASGRAVRGQPDPLLAIGRELRAALSCASQPEGSAGQCEAIRRAGAALARLADEVTIDDSLAGAARVAETRVTRAPDRARASSSARATVAQR